MARGPSIPPLCATRYGRNGRRSYLNLWRFGPSGPKLGRVPPLEPGRRLRPGLQEPRTPHERSPLQQKGLAASLLLGPTWDPKVALSNGPMSFLTLRVKK